MVRIDLSSEIKEQLPAELVSFMHLAGEMAVGKGQSLYLVGGVVRDLLLGKSNFDLDLVVEGDAIELAREFAEIKQAKITTHPLFNTAKIEWDKWSVDFATARTEAYLEPGALPIVRPSSIENDLFRRDFTINAMAICLSPERCGEVIDRYGGQIDLERKLVRILHNQSFTDDATRIWRGLRYEQRLGFQLEEKTLGILKRDIPMLDTISGDRIRYELECVFKEEEPEKVFSRADELGVLTKLHPALKGNGWLKDKSKTARQKVGKGSPSFALYFALLTYRLTDEEREQLISCLRLSKPVAQALRDSHAIKEKHQTLAYPELKRSYIYNLLYGYAPQATLAASVATASPIARQHMELFLHELRYVKPLLNGDDLKKMGIPAGPQIKEILKRLHEARLDGKVATREDEEELVKEWME